MYSGYVTLNRGRHDYFDLTYFTSFADKVRYFDFQETIAHSEESSNDQKEVPLSSSHVTYSLPPTAPMAPWVAPWQPTCP